MIHLPQIRVVVWPPGPISMIGLDMGGLGRGGLDMGGLTSHAERSPLKLIPAPHSIDFSRSRVRRSNYAN